MAIATSQDVAIAIGRPITDQPEVDRVEYWLNAAEVQIKARLGDLTLLDQDIVKYVETEATVARLSNPDGYQSETVDDYTYRFGSETRQVTILPQWWEMLSPSNGGTFYTIGVTSPLDAS